MAAKKHLSRHLLPNGLTVEFYDLSRPTAGDRWQVMVEARVAVPVSPEHLPPELRDRAEEVRAALGPEVSFIKQEIRNFIAVGEVPDLVQNIASQLFLGHPEFAPRFLRKKYQEYCERQTWWRDTAESQEE